MCLNYASLNKLGHFEFYFIHEPNIVINWLIWSIIQLRSRAKIWHSLMHALLGLVSYAVEIFSLSLSLMVFATSGLQIVWFVVVVDIVTMTISVKINVFWHRLTWLRALASALIYVYVQCAYVCVCVRV